MSVVVKGSPTPVVIGSRLGTVFGSARAAVVRQTITDVGYTREMETELDKIEEDHLDCYKDLAEIIESFQKFAQIVPGGP